MADEHRSDDEVLADLERDLAGHDPDRAARRHTHATTGDRPTRALTLTWLAWTATWFITYLVTGNPASLVLATTSAATYPLGLGLARWWWREHPGPSR